MTIQRTLTGDRDVESFLYGTMADCILFPGSLTRKLYKKKIPEIASNVP